MTSGIWPTVAAIHLVSFVRGSEQRRPSLSVPRPGRAVACSGQPPVFSPPGPVWWGQGLSSVQSAVWSVKKDPDRSGSGQRQNPNPLTAFVRHHQYSAFEFISVGP